MINCGLLVATMQISILLLDLHGWLIKNYCFLKKAEYLKSAFCKEHF